MIPHQLATSIAAYKNSRDQISPIYVFNKYLFHLLKRCIKPVDGKVILHFSKGGITLNTRHLNENESSLLLAALKEFKERMTCRSDRFKETREGLTGTVTLFCGKDGRVSGKCGGVDYNRYLVGDREIINGIPALVKK